MSKLKIIDQPSWETSVSKWEENASSLRSSHSLKTFSNLPQMAGITPDTARFLRLKSLWYLLSQDKRKIFLRYFFKRPIKYAFSLIKSYLKKRSYLREGDLFFYGIHNDQEFIELLSKENTLFVLGFSYCHKPFECPSGRFSDKCQNDPYHPVCGQCFIGKATHLLKHKDVITLFIPTVHYIGEKLFELTHAHPKKQILFLITACELSLEMFGDWGCMIGARGIGVRLDGRICNTMRAFKLSEEGVKPGLTVVLDTTQEKMLNLIRSYYFRTHTSYEKA